MRHVRYTLAMIACSMLFGGCATHKMSGDQLARVAKDWSLSIRASQVIPVYPLTEDLQPGDVFLVQTPIEDQVKARKEMLIRVNSLVERARITAKELADAREKQKELLGENSKLRAELDSAGQRIADLTAQIERQAQSIALLQTHVDSLDKELTVARSAYSRAYYVIGREDDLVKKGIVVKEGGANLLVAHPGRMLLPARNLDRDLFQPVDIREITAIEMPDTTRRYQIVSRQSLDDAEVEQRDGAQFRGTLKIANADKFWAPSRFLIIVQR